MVNLEALRAGLAVVAFEGGGGASEALGPDRSVLLPYADAGAMGDAILDLTGDRTRLAAMQAAAAAFAGEHLGWDRYMTRINAMLAESCSSRFALQETAAEISAVVGAVGGAVDGAVGGASGR
jgi:glycosyltransferase involved in cell wall biosynthesis